MEEAHLVEIFDSVQGEGPQVGQPTLFIRFAECDLRCRWCDTPDSWRRVKTCRLFPKGVGEPRDVKNPITFEILDEVLDGYALREGHWASLTGGEPLLQPEAVRCWAAHLRERGLRVHLETHGLAVEALRTCVENIDFVSMDWKLASDVRRVSDRGAGPVPDYHDSHEQFLEVLEENTSVDVCVKVVVTVQSTAQEILEVASRIAKVRPQTPLILQPVTPTGGTREPVGVAALMAHLEACASVLADVRVIPQTHKAYGAL